MFGNVQVSRLIDTDASRTGDEALKAIFAAVYEAAGLVRSERSPGSADEWLADKMDSAMKEIIGSGPPAMDRGQPQL